MKRRLSMALVLIMLCSFAGCGKQKPSDDIVEEDILEVHDDHSKDGRTVVGISMPSQSLERWNRDGAFLKREFENAGCKVILSYGNDLIDEQIDGLEKMIEQGADLLIISSIDANSLESVVKKAAEAAIPIICYDRLILRSPYIDYYVSFDNYKVGALQAEFIRDQLNLDQAGANTYNIELVAGDPADYNAQFFYHGTYDVLAPYIEAGTLVIPSGQKDFYQTATSSWSKELAKERFEGILNSYYVKGKQLDAVCCANDATALGVQEAIDVDYKGTNDIIITGQDADEANLASIVDGKQSMTVYKALSNESIVTFSVGMAILNGETPGEELIENGSWDFACRFDNTSYDNGKKTITAYLLEPVVITKENMHRELVETGYYTEDEQGYFHAVN